MVVPLATGVSENDDYQRACGRRETPLQGTDSFGSLPTQHCTPFIGPEACFGSFPPASEIARELADEYGYPLEDVENLPRVAKVCVNQYGVGGGPVVKDKVARKLRSGEPPDFRDRSEPHLALASLPFPIYINTHYHGFCSRALQAQHKDPRRAVCRWYQDDCDKDPDRATFKGYLPNPANPLVFNLYGHIDEPDSLVLTEDDYLDFLVKIARSGNRLIPGPVQDALTNSSLLFLGFPTSEIGFRPASLPGVQQPVTAAAEEGQRVGTGDHCRKRDHRGAARSNQVFLGHLLRAA